MSSLFRVIQVASRVDLDSQRLMLADSMKSRSPTADCRCSTDLSRFVRIEPSWNVAEHQPCLFCGVYGAEAEIFT